MRKYYLIITAILFVKIVFSQAPLNPSEALHELEKMKVQGTVLYVAAHPDDENTRLLSYLANERKYRTAYLSLTRGDGGQNLIGDEQGISLGYIRTHELLAARNIDGAEQYFSSAYDFGYSKTPEETLKIWDENTVLGEVVFLIRYLKPDIIVCRFPTTGEGGHGHHTASAILAEKAFEISGNADSYPEHIKKYGLQPYKPKRLLWNTFNFGSSNTQREDQLKIDVGVYNRLLAKSYGEIAADSRSQHKSQGFGVPNQRGKSLDYFKFLKGEKMENDIMDGVQTKFTELEFNEYNRLLDSIIQNFSIVQPSKNIPALIRLKKIMSFCFKDKEKLNYYSQKINHVIASLAGIFYEVEANKQFFYNGEDIAIKANVIKREENLVQVQKINFYTQVPNYLKNGNSINNILIGTTVKDTVWLLRQNELTSIKQNISSNSILHQPYWLYNESKKGNFDIPNLDWLKFPINKPDVFAEIILSIDGETFSFETPVVYKFTDPVKGEIKQPISVLVPVSVKFDKDLTIYNPKSKNNNMIPVTINNLTDKPITGNLKVLDDNNNLVTAIEGIRIDSMGVKTIQFGLGTTINSKNLKAQWISNNAESKVMVEQIKYDHIPNLQYHKPSKIILLNTDLKIVGKKIGYIKGAGDKVADILSEMGYDVTMIDEKNINTLNLNGFSSIVTGVRAYNVHTWLNNSFGKLMKYVQAGGNLVIQYNTSTQIGPIKSKIAPYNFSISRTRVTEENAPIKFLKPNHPVFNFPNKLSEKDFTGWVQERSIYHAEKFDTAFVPLISMSDSGEKESDGALITAKFGKGNITYTGLVFFRQLPHGVESAIKLMANILSLK